MKVIRFIIGIILILSSLGGFIAGDIFSACAVLILGLFAVPSISKFIQKKLNFSFRTWQKAAIVFICLVIFASGAGVSETEQDNGQGNITDSQVTQEDIIEEKKDEVQKDNNFSSEEKEETKSIDNEEEQESNKQDKEKEKNIEKEEALTNTAPNNNIKVHYIDVGQADSILIQNGSKAMLIDAGNNADSNLVVNYIKQQGVNKLEYVVGTHAHEDHIGGLDAVINSFSIEKVIMPKTSHTTKTYEDVLIAIKNKGLKIISPSPGTDFQLGDATFKILANNNGSDLNNTSTVIKLIHGKNAFLFQGDAEAEVEQQILNQGFDVKADVIKLGHHGSYTSSTKVYLDKVNPKYAVITVGKDNSYGHPHKETLDKLKSAGIKVYRTDQQGTIIAISDGKSISFNKKEATLNTTTNTSKSTNQNTRVANNTNQSSSKSSNTTVNTSVKGAQSLIISSISLQDDVVTIKNPTNKDINMSGWKLVSVEGNQTFNFPSGFILKSGGAVKVVSGRGVEGDGVNTLKWSGSYIWNNDGDLGQLYDNNGNLVSSK